MSKPLNTKLCNQIDLRRQCKLGQCGVGIFWIGRKVHTQKKPKKLCTLFRSVYSVQTEALTKCGMPQSYGSSLALSAER